MTSQTQKTSNVGLTYGVIGGLAMVVFTLCLYLAGVQTFGNWMLGLVGYAIIIAIASMAASKQKSRKAAISISVPHSKQCSWCL